MTDVNPLKRNTLILLLAAGVILFAQLGRTVLNEHEVFAAEPGREILKGGSIVLQQFAGEYRTKKPPGQSWLIAASLFVMQSESEWAARLPSALAGTGLALVMMWLGAHLVSPRVGLLGGLMTLTCYLVQQRARLAEADTGLSLCVACAFMSLLLPMLDASRSRWKWSLIFWLSIDAGFLLKGPIVLGFVLIPVLVFYGLERFVFHRPKTASTVARVAFWPPALVLGILGLLAWPLSAIYTYPAVVHQWMHETVGRVAGEMRSDPFYSYFLTVPTGVLPWVLFAPRGVTRMRHLRLFTYPAVVLLMCWGIGGFVLVSVIPFKTGYYAMPMIAPLILLSAYGFDHLFFQRFRRKPVKYRQATAVAQVLFAITFAGWLAYQSYFQPQRDHGRVVAAFGKAINEVVPADQTLYLFRTGEDRTSWYLHSRLQQAKELPSQRPVFLLTESDEVDGLRAQGGVELLRAAPYTRHGNLREQRVLVRID